MCTIEPGKSLETDGADQVVEAIQVPPVGDPLDSPTYCALPPDPKTVSDRDLVYGTLHGLPGYEEEWRRRNPGQDE
jgi:hypothetical protein